MALVTGGGRGIGQAISLALGRAGAAVAVNWRRDEESATKTLSLLEEMGARAIIVQGSIDDYARHASLVAEVEEQLGPIGILVHNGGVGSRGDLVIDTDVADVERLFRVHGAGPHSLTRHVLPGMRTQERGDIVMISSVAAHVLTPGGGPYNMAKAALEALAHTLSKEEIDHGIRVNIVAPGFVATEMGDRLIRGLSKGEVADASEPGASEIMGHVCQPEEIADAVTFFVSPQSGYITGQKLIVDGGSYPHRP
ncbi:SDR family NAD(P)-dependent oxidoreductase [Aeromicrobium sp.]|uniref:SDR family NAD(P)-dependent oxidoreductase n=1 Tax=Aeromicrobium sp. TaxID=1871063 RepID=UPI002FC9B099